MRYRRPETSVHDKRGAGCSSPIGGLPNGKENRIRPEEVRAITGIGSWGESSESGLGSLVMLSRTGNMDNLFIAASLTSQYFLASLTDER